MREHSVLSACQWLLDELNAEASVANHAGAAALAAGNYAGAREGMTLGEALSAIRVDVAAVMERLEALVAEKAPEPATKGRRTRGEVYRVPILQELVARGGAGRAGDVLDAVHERMRGLLTDADHAPLRTNDLPRWHVTAAWCRNTLREEGLIRAGSPNGLWEISEAGRRWLEEQETGIR